MASLPSEIFFKDAFSIDVQEYQSTSVTTKNKKAKKIGVATIRFSLFRLSVAVAKSILTRNPADIDLVKEVRAAFYVLDSMVSSPGVDMRVCTGFRKKYRDFSKSSRTGELAQGLTFIFAQEHLNFPLVMDFDGFLDSQKIPSMDSDQKSPDFALVFKHGTTQPSLIESKGACPPTNSLSIKGKLSEALEQCDTADLHIATNAARSYRVKNSYGTFVRLAEEGDGWSSVVCFCDPTNKPTEGMGFPLDAARRYYAAWLTLCGHIDLARALDNNELRLDTVRGWSEIEVDGLRFSIPKSQNSTFNLFTPYLAFRRPGVLQEGRVSQWAIRTEVIHAIVGDDDEQLLTLFNQTIDARTDLQNGRIYFPDHTVFLMPPKTKEEV